MKVLIYNWIPFDEKEMKGGGVTVYTKNLIKYLSNLTGIEVCFLSSGRAYNREVSYTYIEETKNCLEGKCKSFQVVNSPVLSSAHISFCYPQDYLEDTILKEVIGNFIKLQGGFDVIHFQNLEGLSLSVLELKENFPTTKFIYSMHNYYPICPQVMLWQKDSQNCQVSDCGSCCIECMPDDVFKEKVICNQRVAYDREKYGAVSETFLEEQKEIQEFYEGKSFRASLSFLAMKQLQKNFARFRKESVAYINQYIDMVLVVSNRVGEIAIQSGIIKEKVHLDYIGTEVANNQRRTSQYVCQDGILHIAYLGFMRKMKGLYILLNTLEELSEDIAKKVIVTFGTKNSDSDAMKRIEKLKEKYYDIRFFDGYTHEELPQILEGVNLGIVPVLWEDNLPQVAIEMKANGIPILSSNLGGARELSKADGFVFEAGNIQDFIDKLCCFVEKPEKLLEYWEKDLRLVTMEEHIQSLMHFYKGDSYEGVN